MPRNTAPSPLPRPGPRRPPIATCVPRCRSGPRGSPRSGATGSSRDAPRSIPVTSLAAAWPTAAVSIPAPTAPPAGRCRWARAPGSPTCTTAAPRSCGCAIVGRIPGGVSSMSALALPSAWEWPRPESHRSGSWPCPLWRRQLPHRSVVHGPVLPAPPTSEPQQTAGQATDHRGGAEELPTQRVCGTFGGLLRHPAALRWISGGSGGRGARDRSGTFPPRPDCRDGSGGKQPSEGIRAAFPQSFMHASQRSDAAPADIWRICTIYRKRGRTEEAFARSVAAPRGSAPTSNRKPDRQA